MTQLHLPFFLFLPPFLLLLSIMMFFDSTRRTNSIVKRGVLHAFNYGLAACIDFFWVEATKSSRNRRSIVHPAFQLELSHNLSFSVGFCSALSDLVSSHVRFVEIVDEIDSKLDQEVALHLRMVGIVEPIVKI